MTQEIYWSPIVRKAFDPHPVVHHEAVRVDAVGDPLPELLHDGGGRGGGLQADQAVQPPGVEHGEPEGGVQLIQVAIDSPEPGSYCKYFNFFLNLYI